MTPQTHTQPAAPRLAAPQDGREFLSAAIAPASLNADQRTVDVLFFSSADVQRYDWMKGEPFIMRFDPAGADLSLLNNGAPVFDNHADGGGAAAQKGVVEKAWQDKSNFMATLRFSKRPEVAGLWQDIADKIVQKFSMGVNLLAKKELPQEKGQMRVVEVTKWQPFEISTAPLPADQNTRTLSAERTPSMETTTTVQNADAAEILKVGKVLNLSPEFMSQHSDKPIAEFRKLALDEQARLAGPEIRTAHVDVLRDHRDGLRQHATEALANRATPGQKLSDDARPFAGMSLIRLAEECLRTAGVRLTSANAHEVARLAFESTSDFPLILESAFNKVLMLAYESAASGIRQVAQQTTAPDFRPLKRLRIGEMPALELVPESGEFHRGGRTESRESYSIATYGKVWSITRQAIINDDLGAFQTAAPAWGAAAMALQHQLLADLLAENSGNGPTMTDTHPLFYSGHGNLAGSATTIANGLAAARLAMRRQTGVDGVTLINVEPEYLLVPAALEQQALQAVAQIAPIQMQDVNPFMGKLTVVVDPRLDDISATRWYLFAGANVPVLQYAYLAGQSGPFVQSRIGFDVDGMEYKCRLDFGAGAIDHRGAYANAGA